MCLYIRRGVFLHVSYLVLLILNFICNFMMQAFNVKRSFAALCWQITFFALDDLVSSANCHLSIQLLFQTIYEHVEQRMFQWHTPANLLWKPTFSCHFLFSTLLLVVDPQGNLIFLPKWVSCLMGHRCSCSFRPQLRPPVRGLALSLSRHPSAVPSFAFFPPWPSWFPAHSGLFVLSS